MLYGCAKAFVSSALIARQPAVFLLDRSLQDAQLCLLFSSVSPEPADRVCENHWRIPALSQAALLAPLLLLGLPTYDESSTGGHADRRGARRVVVPCGAV